MSAVVRHNVTRLSEEDLYLFAEGTHTRLYEKLGAHVMTGSIRNTALQNRITYYTTIAGARAACVGMKHLQELRAYDLQTLHESLPT
jgi:1,4-alpha-glucan branching enzyme